ncbi:MAG TPA: 2OG-Fe(II) oxygenase [Acidimicrobiales bacterium]|nr:2OG-Fe(II) oxygenase [Acidimicrobiales bacterium]
MDEVTDTTVVDADAMEFLDLSRLRADLPHLHEQYCGASPFPHIVIDEFLPAAAAAAAIKDFPSLDGEHWNGYVHTNERKFSNTTSEMWPAPLQRLLAELQSDQFVDFLGRLTGIEGLFCDHSLEGGGLHQSLAGGFLNVHADFTVHPHHRTWRRRVNLLLYLNEDWKDEYGGQLELWSADVKRREQVIAPIGNRAVVFSTDMDSFHGHPEPMTCPPGVARQSLALYYFTEESQPVVRSTEYRARPGDGARSMAIYADKQMLRAYDWAKRRLNLSDAPAQRLLAKLEKLRHRTPRSQKP